MKTLVKIPIETVKLILTIVVKILNAILENLPNEEK